MKKVVILGVGKSSVFLIEELSKYAQSHDVIISIYGTEKAFPFHPSLLSQKVTYTTIAFTLHDALTNILQDSTIVISLLPVQFHYKIAKECLRLSKAFLNASYLTSEFDDLREEVIKKKLFFLFETGSDPGIDHISTMNLVDKIKAQGGDITSYKSYCGALISYKTLNNLWQYKFTWAPQNILVAGKVGAQYLSKNKEVLLDYTQIFSPNNSVQFDDKKKFGWYANRDSLPYRKIYKLEHVESFLRASLRYENFMIGWKILIDMGLLDTEKKITLNNISRLDWLEVYFQAKGFKGLHDYIEKYPHYDTRQKQIVVQLLEEIHLLDNKQLVQYEETCSQFIFQLLLEAWKLNETEKDLLVMKHEIEYKINNKKMLLESTLEVEGEDNIHTAIAKTVGLPLAFATILFLENTFNLHGMFIPTEPEIYNPLLKKLSQAGIDFTEKITKIYE